MKIDIKFVLELSLEEAQIVSKFLGKMSPNKYKEYGLLGKEAEFLSSMYDELCVGENINEED